MYYALYCSRRSWNSNGHLSARDALPSPGIRFASNRLLQHVVGSLGESFKVERRLLPQVVLLNFCATNHHVVHLIRPVGKAQVSHIGVHIGER